MDDHPRTVYLVARIYYLIREQMDAELAKENITSVQYSVLSLIRGGGGLTSAQLARRYRVKPQSMNTIVKDLESKNLITRDRGPESKKELVAVLSKAGVEKLRRCDDLIDVYESKVFDMVDPADINAFRRMAKTLIKQTGF
jgi:DNA-binding MarR family transcriptional regulator